MRIIKYAFLVVSLLPVFLVVAGIAVYLTVDDANLINLGIRQAESAAGIRIFHGGDATITRTLSPTLSLHDLVLEDTGQQLKIRTSFLQVQVSLPGLLMGRLTLPELELGDTRVEIGRHSSSGKIELPDRFAFRPELKAVRISSISVVRAGEETDVPVTYIRGLSILLDPGLNKLVCRLRAELGNQPLDVHVFLPRIQTILNRKQLPFTLEAGIATSTISAEGQVDLNPSSPTIEASFQGTLNDLARTLFPGQGIDMPGELSVRGTISGPVVQPALADLSVTWKKSAQNAIHPNTIQLSGRIENLMELSGLNISVSGVLENPAWLTPVLPGNIDPVDHITLLAQVSGAYPKLNIQKCRFDARTLNDLTLSLSGRMDLNCGKPGPAPENMDFALSFNAPSTRSARILFFDTIPEFGAITGRARVRSLKGEPFLEDIVVQAQDAKGIRSNLTGAIASFPLDPDISNRGYDLDVSIASTRTSVMADRLGMDLPLPGPLDVRFRIEGDTKALQLAKIDLRAGEEKGIRIRASGSILFGSWDRTDPFETIDLALWLESRNTVSVNDIAGMRLPELGKVTARARLHTVSGHHRIDGIRIKAGTAGLFEMTATGSVDQLTVLPELAATGTQLSMTASGDNAASVARQFFPEKSVPAMGPFTAGAKLKGDVKNFGITDFTFETDMGDHARLAVSGRMENVRAPDSLSLNVRLNSSSLSGVGLILGQKWPEIGPFELNSRISRKEGATRLDTLATMGETRINAETDFVFREGRPFISGKIKAENMFFSDLWEKQQTPVKEKSNPSPYFFSREPVSFDWLKNADADFFVDVVSFGKDQTDIKAASFPVHLESGSLSISPARLDFPKGTASLDVRLDAQEDLTVSIKASGKDINPLKALATSEKVIDPDFNAQLDMDIDLATTGKSRHELAAGMNGKIYVVAKNGRIRKGLLDMIFIDFIGWTASKATGKYEKIRCGVADYGISKGVITTNAFIIDTKNIAVTGEGTIDLSREHLDYVFLPRKKSNLILNAEPVTVNGPFRNLSVTTLPWKSAVSHYGTLVFGPYVFAGWKVFNFLTGVVGVGEKEISPCEEYKKKREQDQK